MHKQTHKNSWHVRRVLLSFASAVRRRLSLRAFEPLENDDVCMVSSLELPLEAGNASELNALTDDWGGSEAMEG